ncbi:hypothetical protein AB0759_22970 [Scytonema tolypothrichoides VB-61278_2]|uniref:Transposase n=1 Tax=Scytonema tolypothrichoides VB-61278_2 TaxID=3232314 RepID=A0ABW8WR54_9CYAN
MAEKSPLYERDISLIKQFVYSLLLENLRQYRACKHTTVMLRKHKIFAMLTNTLVAARTVLKKPGM